MHILQVTNLLQLEKALEILNEWDQRAALIWSEAEQCVISIFTLTDLLMYILSGEFNKMSTIYQALSGNKLITLSASCKLLEACEEFCTNQIHRIAITEPSGDILYLLDLKRILETVHKQVCLF
ncbi:unnamed protein product [Dracunculus medinensis]|uniref:CBS domain-containing protein n=1 Tax=Dracunculus medinensis TaxID=318479 RepID=A0A0N4UN98_DRAME|nr:unnamed protein product [Dracunculus medinensis]